MAMARFLCLCCFALTTLVAAYKEHATMPPVHIPYQAPNTLLSHFAAARRAQDAVIIEQIRNTASIYPLIIDSQAFDQLTLVFTQDVWANYSTGVGVLDGIANVTAALSASLEYVETQHHLGTQVIDIDPSGSYARSLTYYRAVHFRKGQMGVAPAGTVRS